jgi:hypothetical protein
MNKRKYMAWNDPRARSSIRVSSATRCKKKYFDAEFQNIQNEVRNVLSFLLDDKNIITRILLPFLSFEVFVTIHRGNDCDLSVLTLTPNNVYCNVNKHLRPKGYDPIGSCYVEETQKLYLCYQEIQGIYTFVHFLSWNFDSLVHIKDIVMAAKHTTFLTVLFTAGVFCVKNTEGVPLETITELWLLSRDCGGIYHRRLGLEQHKVWSFYNVNWQGTSINKFKFKWPRMVISPIDREHRAVVYDPSTGQGILIQRTNSNVFETQNTIQPPPNHVDAYRGFLVPSSFFGGGIKAANLHTTRFMLYDTSDNDQVKTRLNVFNRDTFDRKIDFIKYISVLIYDGEN